MGAHATLVTKDNAVSYALGIASGKIPLPQMDELRRCYPRIRQYREWDYHYVWLDLPDAGRKAAVQFARSCLKQKYSLRNFLLLAATIALGDRVRMPDSGHGCVSLVARALQEAGIRFDRKPTDMTPADLAKRFGVTP